MEIEQKFHEVEALIKESGRIALDYFNSGDTSCEQKTDGSVVTKIDKAIEEKLITYIKANFPGDMIVGEEHGDHAGDSGFVWHIDPIDGTDNFLRKIPFCAISVARLGDTPADSFGIIHNPITGQTFSSFLETEGGVYENERVCQLTAEPLGGRYILSVGRGKEKWMKPVGYKIIEAFGLKYGKGTMLGCAALELAYVAANRVDAFLTYGLKTYDYAAGLFLVKAAGGAISVFREGKWQPWLGNLKELCSKSSETIFVSHPAVHQEFLATIGSPESWRLSLEDK